MKLCLLGPATSIHFQRWVTALAARGHAIHIVTQHPDDAWQSRSGAASTAVLPYRGGSGYLCNAIAFGRVVKRLRPDLVNVHYASGYGLTSALMRYRPTLLSVWGSDVFDFPYESWAKGYILRWNLGRATRLASTSHVMAQQANKLLPSLPQAFVTPFGVDCESFCFKPRLDHRFITIGTVKTLAHKYGIDLLIDAFARVLHDLRPEHPSIASRLRLMLVGGGEERMALEALATRLGVRDRVEFVGAVAHGDVPDWLNQLDIFVAASRLDSESFGVAAVEASACGLPVVVSAAGGLPEVVMNNETGFVVPREDAGALALAIKQLVLDGDLRQRMGAAGRRFVLATYEWEHCVDLMESAYREVIEAHPS
jgi:L-malate glycosyltransferase